jgi:uncharacterized delta-60 repeat protein
MAGRTSYYGGIVLDGLVFHIDTAKQESYAKRGLRYTQNGNTSLFVDFADTSKISSSKNATGSVINGATFSNFAPYHLSDHTSPYWHRPGNIEMISTDTRNSSPVWTTLEHSWDANGDANDSKGSAHGIIVTPVGQTFSTSTMTYQSGKVGSAFSFNGSNFISLPENTLKFTSDFSVSLWFYTPTGITNSTLISSFYNIGDYTESNGWSVSYNTTNKSISFYIGIRMGFPGNPSSQYYGISLTTGNNVFLMDQWNHVLITRKANTRSRIYVNGVLSTSDTNIYNPTYNVNPHLSYIGASFFACPFGQCSGVIPFYTAAPAGLKIDIVQTFTSELDSVAAGELYTMSNLYSSVAFNNTGIGTFYGNIEFDGVDDYVSLSPTPEMNGTTDITVSSWFYVNNLPTGDNLSMVVSRYNNINTSNGWELYYDNKGVVYFGGRENNSLYICATASFLLKGATKAPGLTANGGWYNVVGTKSLNTWKLYITEPNKYVKYNNSSNDVVIYTYPYKQTLSGSVTAGTGTIPFEQNNLFLGKSFYDQLSSPVVAGTIDTSFVYGTGFTGSVSVMAIQSNGKIVVGGNFTNYNGTNVPKIIKLNTDGSNDTSFVSGTGFNDWIMAMAIQSDDKIVVGGYFTTYNGTSANRIIRLNSNGSIDTSFVYGTGFNSIVTAIAIQPDGKIIVTGNFGTNNPLDGRYNGTIAPRVIRLNTDGSVDTSFVTGTGFNWAPEKIFVQSDGKILFGGNYTTYNGIVTNYITRLNTNGSIDTSFVTGTGFNGTVTTIIQSDSKILFGGYFTTYNGTNANNIIRLNMDGSVDTSFVTGTGFTPVNNGTHCIDLQSDGKIIVGGNFTNYNGISANKIIRLNINGSQDTSFVYGTGFTGFTPGVSSSILRSIAIRDGKVLVVGEFLNYNGTGASKIIRLNLGGSISTYMDGRIMSVSIYNRALSLAEINQNYDSFSKRIVKTDFDRGLNNPNVLITYNVLDEYGDITEAIAGISAREVELGKNVTVIAGYSNLPNDLSSFSHIWDIDVFTDQLVTLNSSKYTTYLQGGGALFLLGERAPFVSRNNTLVTFLNSVGAGSVVLDLVFDSDVEHEVQNQFLLANSNSVVRFPYAGRYSSIGNGISIVKTKVVDGTFPIGTGGSAVLWSTGSLTNAPKGAIVSVMDVNIWSTNYAGAPHYGSDFIKNISLIMDRF